jgi:hypothetical protein
MADLLNYDTSWLNPALKLLIVAIFVFVAWVYFRAKRTYAGRIGSVVTLLFWMATFAALAALLRYFGHGTQFGFTAEYSLKWFQSLGYLVQALLFVAAPWALFKSRIPGARK